MSKQKNRVPEAFHPGVYIKEELEARNWRQHDLTMKSGLSITIINALINRKSKMNAKRALALEKAFGSSAESWMALQSAYEIALALGHKES